MGRSGRPQIPESQRRLAPIGVCLTLDERRLAQEAADRAKRPLSRWCADAIATAARQSQLRAAQSGQSGQSECF
jgi:hypothetical protein